MKTVSIPMAAFGKARPRFTRKGKPYMPDTYRSAQQNLRLYFGAVPEGPVILIIEVYRSMPKGWSKAKKLKMIGRYTEAGPDRDNVAGAVMDSLFNKDGCVVDVRCASFWSDRDELIVTIIKAEN